MIIDEFALAGTGAYLRRGDGAVAIRPGETGATEPVLKGEALEINAIDLMIECADGLSLLDRQAQPLLTLDLKKEMFPGLFADPHCHRVHQIGGYEDLRRAEMTGFRILEADGIPSLVSPGTPDLAKWRSARYPVPRRMVVTAVAWTLAPSRATPKEAFEYDIVLRGWDNSTPVASNTLTATPSAPGAARHYTFAQPVRLSEFQFEFSSVVYYDSPLVERHGIAAGQSMGTALLQSIALLEKRESPYEIFSIHELIAQSTAYQFLDPAAPLKSLYARLHFAAVLNEGESVSIRVGSGGLAKVQARLDGSIRSRPPEPRPVG